MLLPSGCIGSASGCIDWTLLLISLASLPIGRVCQSPGGGVLPAVGLALHMAGARQCVGTPDFCVVAVPQSAATRPPWIAAPNLPAGTRGKPVGRWHKHAGSSGQSIGTSVQPVSVRLNEEFVFCSDRASS